MTDPTQTTDPFDDLDSLRLKPGELSIPKINYLPDNDVDALTAMGKRVAVQDTREQTPLRLDLPTVRRGLATGDYSLVGYEDIIAVERKSASDLISCCGRSRRRFNQCVDRLLGFPYRLVIVEHDWATIATECRHGRVGPDFVERLCIEWQTRGLPFIFRNSRAMAARTLQKFLERSAREYDRTTRGGHD